MKISQIKLMHLEAGMIDTSVLTFPLYLLFFFFFVMGSFLFCFVFNLILFFKLYIIVLVKVNKNERMLCWNSIPCGFSFCLVGIFCSRGRGVCTGHTNAQSLSPVPSKPRGGKFRSWVRRIRPCPRGPWVEREHEVFLLFACYFHQLH